MFRVIQFEDKLFKPALSNWLIVDKGETKCHWPFCGLIFKLKNLVAPPLELNIEERKFWRLIKCVILPNGTKSFFIMFER